MNFEWREDRPPAPVRDEEDLVSMIDAAAKAAAPSKPPIANLSADNGATLRIVLGGPETVLGFTPGDGKSPYYASRGQSDDIEPVLTCYLFMTHHTEFPRRNVIS